MFNTQFTSDQWHHEAETIARRNGIRSRRWGMRVTVYNDANPANNGDYVLSYALANTNRQSNSNWLKVADIGETWGGGGSVYTFENGLTEAAGVVQIGGSFTEGATVLEVGSGQYFDILTGGVEDPIISWGGQGVYGPNAEVRIGANSLGSLQVSETSIVFDDDRVGAAAVGIEYAQDLGLNFLNNPRSIPDVGFVNGFLAGSPITPPTAGEDGYTYVWDDAGQQWELQPVTTYVFSSGLTEIANVVTAGGTATQNIVYNSDVAGTRTFSIGVSAPFNSIILRTSNAGNTNRSNLNLSSSLATLSRSVGANSFSISIGDTNGTITDQLSSGGLRNAADYSANFSDRNLIDFGFATTHIGEQAVDALVTNPTVSEDGYVIAWNNTNLEYELVPQSGGGGVSFGTSTQIPIMNTTNDDFIYSANFIFNSSNQLIIGDAFSQTATFTAQQIQGGGSIFNVNGRAGSVTNTAGGNLTLLAGSGYSVAGNNPGGSVEIRSGGGYGSAQGGNIQMIAGNGNGTGVGGNLLFRPGTGSVDGFISAETPIFYFGLPSVSATTLLVGTGGTSTDIDGIHITLAGGDAYGVSGNGDGGRLYLQSGLRRTAGAGIDGDIFLDSRNGNVAFGDNIATDFEGGQRIIYIQDSTAQPSASPADGVFFYSVTGELQVLNETGPTLSLAGRATIVTESGTSVSLGQQHRGAIVKLTNAGAVTITLADLGNNYTTTLLYTGTTSVSFTGYDNFFSVGGADQILDQYGMVFLLHETSNDWYAKGDLS